MSVSLISRSADLSALVNQKGYNVHIRGAYLVVKGIPYLTESGEIEQADIVTSLDLEGDKVIPPSDHTVWWTGKMPHTATGESMESYLVCTRWDEGYTLDEGIIVYMQWSRKPKKKDGSYGYVNYCEKIETYANEVGSHAEIRYPSILDITRLGVAPDIPVKTRFKYPNTASYRNGTRGIEKRIEDEIVAVVGVGGSGSYLVDILMKTEIKELHMYDDDVLQQHNAFRMAGAAKIEELGGTTLKVDWHQQRYIPVREKGVYAHRQALGSDAKERLANCTTVFIAVDNLSRRRDIQKACEDLGVLHISVGIGVEIEGRNNDQLGGMVKVETLFNANSNCLDAGDINNSVDVDDGVYGNIQTAELNMLSAAIAIVEWKGRRHIYRSDRTTVGSSVIYTTSSGTMETVRMERD